jgi:LuxR family maltose regulon positive regulatory protein
MFKKPVSFHEGEINIRPLPPIQSQLLATKFYVPASLGPLIARPRLGALLNESLKRPFTLVSAPAGFGKTTLLSSWASSLQTSELLVAWLSLDEEDNDPQLFWTYVLAALQRQHPKCFGPLLQSLQSPQAPPLKFVLTVLINLLLENDQQVVLILDDYHLVTNPEIHKMVSYLVQHIPPQFHLIVATRSDPPLQLIQWRAREQILEVRTQQLRCTTEETSEFFREVMRIQLPEEITEKVMARTEGWLVGLQLLGLSLPEQADPLSLLEEIRGDQHYIVDYLTEVVLRQQPQEVQMFLLCTSILEQFSASLCDTVLQAHSSQQILEQLDRKNLFLVSLDNKQEWYRYHALFAEALRSQLEQNYSDLLPMLHARASRWYAQHHQTTPAILHALHAHEWQWAADLIERKSLSLMALTWGASQHQLAILQHWLRQLPTDVMASRPRLCLACVHMLWTVAPPSMLDVWFNAAEAKLTASLSKQISESTISPMLTPEAQREQEDLLGEVITWRAYLQSFSENGEIALALCQQALSLLSAENTMGRAVVAIPQLMTYYTSAANDAVASVECGLQGCMLAQTAGHTTLAIIIMGITAKHMMGAGRLHEALKLTQQAIQLGKESERHILPDVGWPAAFQAEILREWNQLDAGLALAQEALALCQQTESLGYLKYIMTAYTVLLRLFLSCNDLEAARTALQQVERVSMSMNRPISLHFYSLYTTVDRVRLWLACGELDRATRWVQDMDLKEHFSTPFARERQEVACVRVLLANKQPMAALQRLEPVLQRATAGQRWGHVIEIRLLQALAQQMLHEEPQALATLWEAVRLGEPEGYLRCFVEEGEAMAALLCKLREKQHKGGPTPYLDRVLAAFPNPSQTLASQPKRTAKQTSAQSLLEPLSERELQVLQLMEKGASNQDIARELVIAIDTVKRHVSHILAKLDAQNRVQAVKQAYKLGLLERED